MQTMWRERGKLNNLSSGSNGMLVLFLFLDMCLINNNERMKRERKGVYTEREKCVDDRVLFHVTTTCPNAWKK